MGRKYFLTTFENAVWRALGPCPRTCSFSSRGLRTEQWGKQPTAALGRPLPPPRKRNTPFWNSPGPEPASRVPLAVRYTPAPPGLSQSEHLDGRGFQQRGGEWVWIGSLEDGDVAEGGRFVSELRLWHTVQDWC